MRLDRSTYTLSSGRTFYAHGGILGLSGKDPTVLFNGYDGEVWRDGQEDYTEGVPFAPAERKEIAEHMIGLWRTWGGL